MPDSDPFVSKASSSDATDAPVRGAAFLFCAILALILLGGCFTDSSDGAMFRADVQRTGVFPSGGPTTIDGAAWSFKTGHDLGSAPSSPAVSNGTVYIGSSDEYRKNGRLHMDGSLYAIDAETGQEQWASETNGPVESSPAVSGGTVYIGSGDGYLYAIDAGTGQEQWAFETDDGVYSSPAVSSGTIPAISGGTVYVGSSDDHLYAIE